MQFIEYCPKCGDIGMVSDHKCVYCNCKTIETKYSLEEYLKDRTKIKQIINELYKNSSEFNEELYNARENKVHQERFRPMNEVSKSVLQEMGAIPKPNANKVECPYCHSNDVSKVSTLGRTVSVSIFGLASKKIGKQWHCNHCKSDF